jgi:hypothetical protein
MGYNLRAVPSGLHHPQKDRCVLATGAIRSLASLERVKERHMFNRYRTLGLETNPFPSETYARNDDDLFVDEVVAEELQAFRTRLIGGAIVEGRSMSFLWSLGAFGADTGFGKTATLKRMAREINRDWGLTTLTTAGASLSEATDHPICATYVIFNSKETNGLYAGLFEAVRFAANVHPTTESGASILWLLRERALSRAGADSDNAYIQLPRILQNAQQLYGRGLSPLRPDFIEMLVDAPDSDSLANALSQVSITTRQRSGHAYFQAFLCLAAAGGMTRVFTFLDQIEDLANPYVTTKKKRFQEVERFRDTLIEDPIIGKLGSFVLTLHRRAEDAIIDAWINSRLPSFEPELRTNLSRVLRLGGLRDDRAAETLARAYLEPARTADAPPEPLWPFTRDAISTMRVRNAGRISKFLSDCYSVLAYALDSNAEPPLDGAFVEEVTAPEMADEAPGAAYATDAALRGERAGDEILGRL